jgi:hypothetical protein
MTSDPVFTVVVVTPAGILKFMAEPEFIGSVWWLRRAHVQGASANSVGVASLIVLAQALLEKFEYDEIVVEGAVRTTGAHPGRRSRAHRFFRRVRPSAAARGNGLPETIPAMTTLVHCGMVLLKAKRAIEALLESPVVIVELPTVADENMLIAELAKSGIDARSVSADLEAPSTVHERQG